MRQEGCQAPAVRQRLAIRSQELFYLKRVELCEPAIDVLPIDSLYIGVMAKKPDLLPGTLDMLILKTLTRAPLHGYGIALSIKRLSDDVLTVEEGSLYPALQRLLLAGWVKAEWKMTETRQAGAAFTR